MRVIGVWCPETGASDFANVEVEIDDTGLGGADQEAFDAAYDLLQLQACTRGTTDQTPSGCGEKWITTLKDKLRLDTPVTNEMILGNIRRSKATGYGVFFLS